MSFAKLAQIFFFYADNDMIYQAALAPPNAKEKRLSRISVYLLAFLCGNWTCWQVVPDFCSDTVARFVRGLSMRVNDFVRRRQVGE